MRLAGSVVLLILIPAVSSLQNNILFVFKEPIEVKVVLLFENVLASTVTESKCLRMT